MSRRPDTNAVLNDREQAYKFFIRGWQSGQTVTRLRVSRLARGKDEVFAQLSHDEVSTSPALDVLRRVKDLTIRLFVGNCPQAVCPARWVLQSGEAATRHAA